MKYKYCSNCGKRIPKSTKFCPYCGTKQFFSHLKHRQRINTFNNLTHNNYTYNNSTFIHTNKSGFKGLIDKITSRIYHIPTADFSHSRLIARRIVTIIIIGFTLLGTILPLITSCLSSYSNGGTSIGNINTPTMLLALFGLIIDLLIEYFGTHWLFNVSWIHFWKTWTIKKIIIILVILVGGFGLYHHSTHPSNQLPSSVVDTTSNVGNGFQLVAHRNSFTFEGGPEAGDDVHVNFHISHVSYDGSTLHITCDRSNNENTNTKFTFKIQNGQIVKAKQD